MQQFFSDLNGSAGGAGGAAPDAAAASAAVPPRGGDPNCKLFVGQLPPSMNDAALRALFSHYGLVTEAEVMRNRDTGASRMFAFVHLATPEQAAVAISALNGFMIEGRQLLVSVKVSTYLPVSPPVSPWFSQRVLSGVAVSFRISLLVPGPMRHHFVCHSAFRTRRSLPPQATCCIGHRTVGISSLGCCPLVQPMQPAAVLTDSPNISFACGLACVFSCGGGPSEQGGSGDAAHGACGTRPRQRVRHVVCRSLLVLTVGKGIAAPCWVCLFAFMCGPAFTRGHALHRGRGGRIHQPRGPGRQAPTAHRSRSHL